MAFALLALAAAPASAQEIPSEPLLVHLKGYEDFMLAWSEDEGVHLSNEGDHWVIEPVREEALVDLGWHRILHDETGRCLTAGALVDEVHAPLDLVDCDEADAWTVVFDTAPVNADYRFLTPEGYHLGLEHTESREEHSPVPTEGAEVFALDVPASLHGHEWHFKAGEVLPPQPPSESPSPSPEISTSPPAKPQLPTTGTGLGVVVGAGAVALAGGAALVMWWQRRRTLRSHW